MTGGGGTVGNALVDHPDVAMITFTGSPEVGWGIKGRAPRKKVGLELGNNAPVIVEPDADLELAADEDRRRRLRATRARPASRCSASTSTTRCATSSSSRSSPRVEALKVGDPLDDATDVSALIAPVERDRIVGWIDEAIGGGAKVATGGEVARRACSTPTVLTNVTPDMKVCTAGGVRPADRRAGLRLARRGARAGERQPLRPPGRGLHPRPQHRAARPRTRSTSVASR